MMAMRKGVAFYLALAIFAATTSPRVVLAQEPRPQPQARSFSIPQSGVAFETGDTWVQNGQTIRLYGVQACIRGTPFINVAGAKGDCGEASLAYLAAVIRDTKPDCAPLFQTDNPPTIHVVCQAHVGSSTLDLGTIMITQGFGFAAFARQGDRSKPVYMPYLVAELTAQKVKAGLWAGVAFTHPYSVLSKAVAQ